MGGLPFECGLHDQARFDGGGTPTTICTATGLFGLSWSAHGIIFGEFGKGILHVSPDGGAPDVIVPVCDDEVADAPQMLPDGRAVLFTVRKRSDPWDKAQVVVQSLDGGARKTIIDGGADGKYVPTGHLVYAVSGVLMAVPFDLRTLATRDRSVAIVEGVRRANYAGAATANAGPASPTSSAQYTFSATGALAYVPGPWDDSSATVHDLALLDRKGPSLVPVKLPPARYNVPRASPDGRWAAFESLDARGSNVWLYELAGTSATRRLTFGGNNQAPTWSADSQWIAFTSDREGASGIFRQRADGAGAADRLTKAEAGISHIPQSWSADGEHLLFTALTANHSLLWLLSLKDGRATRFADVESPAAVEAEFSPDGRWVAYYVREGETNATYVQPFPLTGTKYLVPAAGAAHPFWSRSGGEITVSLGAVQNASLTVTTTPHFAFGRPDVYSRAPLQQGPAAANLRRNLDPLPDGRILGVIAATSGPRLSDLTEVVVVLNWFDELRQRVPVP